MAFLFNNASVPDVNEDSFCLLGKSFGVLAKRKAVKYLVEDGDGTCTPSQLLGVQSPSRGKRVLDSEVLPFLGSWKRRAGIVAVRVPRLLPMWPSTSMSAFRRLSGAGQEDRKHRTSGCLPLPRACKCPPSLRKVRQNSESKLRFVEEDIRQASPTPVFSDSISSSSISSSLPLLLPRHTSSKHLFSLSGTLICAVVSHVTSSPVILFVSVVVSITSTAFSSILCSSRWPGKQTPPHQS